MNDIELQKIADESYDRFIKDDSIIGFDSLLKPFGGGSRLRNKIRKLIYDKYGKENIIKIYRHRLAKSAHKNRTSESYHISPEQREKMINGIKQSWKDSDDRKEKHKEMMIKHCHPNAWTASTNKKRTESRRGYRHTDETIEKIRNSLKGTPLSLEHKKALCVPKIRSGSLGIKRSEETKLKLSKITTEQWKNGIHKPTYKSKGQIEVAELLKQMGYKIREEFFIGSKPYDILIQDENIILEFNGTFWHRDPRFYDNSDICRQIWEYDKNKLDIARKLGYTPIVIWQYDWERNTNKFKLLEEIINGIKQ